MQDIGRNATAVSFSSAEAGNARDHQLFTRTNTSNSKLYATKYFKFMY